jgi:hypothetical protein
MVIAGRQESLLVCRQVREDSRKDERWNVNDDGLDGKGRVGRKRGLPSALLYNTIPVMDEYPLLERN